ncbi:MAG TPA: hypothetical protein VN622_11600 [Clostridia bacterium]|nr:hypothetical protein [Clostridia bacterium]
MTSERSARRSAASFAARRILLLAVLGLVLAGPAMPAFSADKQLEPYALIYGTVWTPDNRPASGVRIKIRRTDEKKARWERISDRRGEFAQRVPAGKASYIVWADVKTKGKAQPQLEVRIENDERQDVGLHLTE